MQKGLYVPAEDTLYCCFHVSGFPEAFDQTREFGVMKEAQSGLDSTNAPRTPATE